MEWEYILEVPFESKKVFMPKSRGKYIYSGSAFFMINKSGRVLRDFVQLDVEKDVSIRPNDNDMMFGKTGKGTDYWNNKIVQAIRPKYFPSSGINKTSILINEELKNKMNEFAIQQHGTSLCMEGLITGSNTSGADARIKSTPFYYSTNDKYFSMRFINPLKKMRISKNNYKAAKKYPINKQDLERYQTINLDQYLKIFNKAKRYFYEYNPEMYGVLFPKISAEQDVTYKIYFADWTKNKAMEELKEYKNKTKLLLEKYRSAKISKQTLVNSYRGILRTLLLLEKQIINKPILKNREVKGNTNFDAAHILDVKDLKVHDELLWKIADINNGILLPKDYHWSFDKEQEFYINEEFEIIRGDLVIDKINEEYINPERIKYMKERNKATRKI